MHNAPSLSLFSALCLRSLLRLYRIGCWLVDSDESLSCVILFPIVLYESLLALEFLEPREDDGWVKAACEVRVDKGQAHGSRLVDQKGPSHR